MKLRCSKCKAEKPIEEFRKRPNRPETGKRLGRCSPCRECEKRYANSTHGRRLRNARTKKSRDRMREHNPEKLRAYERKNNLWRLYRIRPEVYNEMLTNQGGVCAICGEPPKKGRGKKLHVDHCHTTNVIRGLLCAGCNAAIGHFDEDPERMLKAVEYLNTVPMA